MLMDDGQDLGDVIDKAEVDLVGKFSEESAVRVPDYFRELKRVLNDTIKNPLEVSDEPVS